MHDSTDITVGTILQEGVPFLHNFGSGNTFLGSNAGNMTMGGYYNTAIGYYALFLNTTGSSNRMDEASDRSFPISARSNCSAWRSAPASCGFASIARACADLISSAAPSSSSSTGPCLTAS